MSAIRWETLSAQEDLQKLGIKVVSAELQKRGLKVGGGLAERAERLWAVKDMDASEIPNKWLSKSARKAIGRGATREAAVAPPAPPKKAKPRAEPAASECPSPRVDGAAIQATYRFDFDPLDCAETSPQAYEDLDLVLGELCSMLGLTKETAVLYDPYFCAGAVKRRLGRLGWSNVLNDNVDFYESISRGTVPPFDILVTNPPYSGDHIGRLMAFCREQNKPWFCLMPHYSHLRDDWSRVYGVPAGRGGWRVAEGDAAGHSIAARGSKRNREESTPAPGAKRVVLSGGSVTAAAPECLPPAGMFLIAPTKRYSYFVPKGMGADGSANGKKRTNTGPRGAKTSPFVSLWYCWAGTHSRGLLDWWKTASKPPRERPVPLVVSSPRELPKALLDPSDPMR
jgi:hypothetical protein